MSMKGTAESLEKTLNVLVKYYFFYKINLFLYKEIIFYIRKSYFILKNIFITTGIFTKKPFFI